MSTKKFLSRALSFVFSFALGFAVAALLWFIPYRIALPLKPFIYQAF